jgi:transposase
MKNTYEIARRWHAGHTLSDISRTLDYDRKTIRKTIRLMEASGIKRQAPLPDPAAFAQLLKDNQNDRRSNGTISEILLPYKDELMQLVEHPQMPLKPKLAFEVICQRHQLAGPISYSSFKRFYRSHCRDNQKRESTCRIETDPGELAQIDYAKMGLLFDPQLGRRRAVHAFISTLAHSRHKFVEFTFKQDQRSFTASHVHMFGFFGGIPVRLNFDNLKSGVIKPDLYDPEFNRTYQEMAEFYGCFLDPCRVAKPKDKAKVERDVQTIRQQFYKLMALNPKADIHTLNRLIKHWLVNEYGQKPHGTTGIPPYQLFCETELPALKQLPKELFEIAAWKQAKVHPDNYVQFGKQFFSVPHTIVEKTVWIRATDKILTVYGQNQQVIKQHLITKATRHTDWNDFPENIQAVLHSDTHQRLITKAAIIGPNFKKLICQLLGNHAFINLRRVQGLIRLNDKYPRHTLESAATYILEKNINPSVKNIKRLLETQICHADQPPAATTEQQTPGIGEKTKEFIRTGDYFLSP